MSTANHLIDVDPEKLGGTPVFHGTRVPIHNLFDCLEGGESVDDFLAQIPPIPAGSLSAICCWGLLDLLPQEALPRVIERFHSFLKLNGVLFTILREPSLTAGAETRWWFESLTVLGSSDTTHKPFPYPPVTNRQMEQLFPGGNVKTFLTRSHRREVLGVK